MQEDDCWNRRVQEDDAARDRRSGTRNASGPVLQGGGLAAPLARVRRTTTQTAPQIRVGVVHGNGRLLFVCSPVAFRRLQDVAPRSDDRHPRQGTILGTLDQMRNRTIHAVIIPVTSAPEVQARVTGSGTG